MLQNAQWNRDISRNTLLNSKRKNKKIYKFFINSVVGEKEWSEKTVFLKIPQKVNSHDTRNAHS